MKQTEFYVKAVPMVNGQLATLLYPSFYPWIVSQVIKVENEKELNLYSDFFSKKSLLMYFAKNGDRSFFVVQGRGCTPGKQLDINQRNHSKVYGDIQSCLQAAADWWSEYKNSGQQIPLSL